MKYIVRIVCFLALVLAGTTAAFPGGQQEAGKQKGAVRVRYMTFHVGADPAAELEQKLIARFRERFAGQYVLEVEEVPGDHAYTEKLKTLIVSDQMPDVWEGKEPDFNYRAWKAGKAADLSPFLETDASFRSRFLQKTIEIQKRDWEGQVPWFQFRQPNEWGYFYNKEMFAKAGLSGPARTWEEFWSQCEKLKTNGVYPVAMQTADNAWLTQHWLMALLVTAGPPGRQFVNTPDPEDYEVKVFIDAVGAVQRMLRDYAQPDALGANYNLGAASFLGERSAMISNGPWMISSFRDPNSAPEGFIDKVGWAVFPQGAYIGGMARVVGGLAVNPSRGQEVLKGAVELLKIMQEDWFAEESFTVLGHRPAYDLPEELLDTNPLIGAWEKEKRNYGKYEVLGLQNVFHRSAVDALQNYLPLLAQNELSPRELAAKLNQAAREQ